MATTAPTAASTAASTAAASTIEPRVPHVTFTTNDAHFTIVQPGSVHAPFTEGPFKVVRVVVAELGHAEWGLIAAEANDSMTPEFMGLIDQTFWFEADEILGRVKISRFLTVPPGTLAECQFIFPSTLDFTDFVRAISEAKSHFLYHHLRMGDVLSALFLQQFQITAVSEAAEGSTASGSVTAAEAAGNGHIADAPAPPLDG